VPKNALTIRSVSQIPAAIERLWGSPPILRPKTADDYWKLACLIAGDVEPASTIEWMYLKDVVDCTFEIRRLRKCKAWLSEPHRTDRYGFIDILPSLERIDRMLGRNEARRTGFIREIERCQESFASRLQKASEKIIDGEYTTDDPVSGPAEDGGAVKPDADPARRDVA